MWVKIKDVCDVLEITSAEFYKKYPHIQTRPCATGEEVHTSSLPSKLAPKLAVLSPSSESCGEPAAPANIDTTSGIGGATVAPVVVECNDGFHEKYERAPNYNKRKFNEYYPIVLACEKLSGKAIEEYVTDYNQHHPTKQVTLKTVYRKLKLYKEQGRVGLLGNYGKNRGRTTVPEVVISTFENIYYNNGGVTLESARKATVGHAINMGLPVEEVNRSVGTFKRCLDNRRAKGAQVLAKYGYKKFNTKHEPYIRRDDSNILAGCEWVSDHFKLDTYCIVEGCEKPVRPWVTWYRDNKSGKAISWSIHVNDPSTDDLLAAIRLGILAWGKPQSLQMDQGADYMSTAFSGGRGKNSKRDLSLLSRLGIVGRFAQRERAQTKRMERDHRDINSWFSTSLKGYCGSNTVNRPENVLAEFKAGRVETFEEVKQLFDVFMRDVYDKLARTGNLAGQSPEQVWAREYPIARERGLIHSVTDDELAVLCYRRSKVMKVMRCEIYDSETRSTYKSDRLPLYEGRKVYLCRDQANNKMDHAFVYDADTDEFLCEAWMNIRVAIRAETEEELHTLGAALAQDKRIVEQTKEMIADLTPLAPQDVIAGMATYAAVIDKGAVENLPAAQTTIGATMLTSVRKDITKAKQQRTEEIYLPDLDDLDAINAAAPLHVEPKKRILDWFDDDEEELMVNVG